MGYFPSRCLKVCCVSSHLTCSLNCVQVYLDLDFTLLEMNPFTLDAAGQPFPLDMRGELDDTAAFRRSVPPA